jgi:N-acetylmuramoyl-L-alanine amidase
VLERRTGQSIGWVPSPNFGQRSGLIDTVVLHYTVTGTLEETVDLFKETGRGTSAHYVIGKDGRVVQMVDIEKKAWHAGASEFQGRPDVNDFSIGIELVNWGLLKERDGVLFVWPQGYGIEYHGGSPLYVGGEWWDAYTENQYRVLSCLLDQIRVHYPAITAERIVGHGDVALPRGRKIDPGLAFDWERVRKS